MPAIATLLPMLLVGLLAWRHGAGGLVAIVGVVLAWAALNVAAFANGIWLSAALPMTAAGPPAIAVRRRAAVAATGGGRGFSPARANCCSMCRRPASASGWRKIPTSCPSRCARTRRSCSSTFQASPGSANGSGRVAVRELLNGFYRLVDEEAIGVGRRHHQLHRRRRDGAVRPAAIGADRCLQCRRVLRRAQPPHDGVAGRASRHRSGRGSASSSARISAPSWRRGSAARTSRSPPPATPSMWQAG